MKGDTMSLEMQSSNKYSRPAGDMEFTLDVKRSSRPQENSKVVKQKILSLQTNQILKSQDKHKIESSFGQPYHDRPHELRRRAGDGLKFPPKSSTNSQKPRIPRKANKDDELVKHMSNLPGYLQRVEKGENLQEKALNFGVLDWERLEKWKHKKSTQPRSNTKTSPSASNSPFKAGGSLTLSTTIQSKGLAPPKKQSPSHCPHLNPSHEEGFSRDVKQSRGKVIHQHFETASRNTLDGQRNPHRSYKSSGRNHSEMKFERTKRKDSAQKMPSEKEISLSGLKKHEFSQPCKDKTNAQNSFETNRMEEFQASEYYLGKKHCPGDHRNIVLLLPKHSPKKSCSEIVQTSVSGTSFDGKLREAKRERVSDGFSSEVVHSAELYSEILHSCPLPIGVVTSPESDMRSNDASCTFLCSNETPAMLSQGKCIDENASSGKPSSANGIDTSKRLDHDSTEPAAVKGRHSSPNHQFSFGLDRISRSLSFKESSAVPPLSSTYSTIKSGAVRSVASKILHPHPIQHSCPIPVGVETNSESDRKWLSYDASCIFMGPNETPNTPSSVNAIRTSKRLDEEATEQAAVKGRHPSPNRRFSFGLGRVSRSFSFKEGSTVPQLSPTYATVKSGPVGSELSDSLDNANGNKANILTRVRSSPLRRLLDPLLKFRVINPHHSAEAIQSLTGNLSSTSEVINCNESLQDKKHEASTVQALLQLTINNGLPLFKFVVNNKSDILVSVKKSTASGKDNAGCIYAFYSVHEIKKKSGSWINQGPKGKDFGFGYNVIGQMKVFSSHDPDLTVQSSEDQFTVRESVLYNVDLRQTNQETQELVPNRELAAIIVKIPVGTGNSSDDGDQRNKCKELTGKGLLDCSQEDRDSNKKGETQKFNSTTVILPGGVHGMTNKGLPSPLLERWKSGGSCDCGGWDVGCKLQVLTNDDQGCKLPGPSISCSKPDHFDLFNQGGAHDNRPIFSLAPFKKGIYSVEFSASISLLQAFSVCVAVMSGHKSFDYSEVNNNLSSEANRGEVFTKYVPSPPPSPVGRV